MKKYLRIYKQILSINLSRVFMYRTDAILGSFISTAWGGFAILTMVILTSKTHNVLGWTRTELILLSGVYSIVIGLFHTLLSHNFSQMSKTIHYGELDGILLKPMDSQFFLSMRYISIPTFIRTVAGLCFVIWFVHVSQIILSPFGIFVAAVLSVAGILSIYSLWFLVATFLIWSSNLSNLVDLLGMTTGIAKYPKEVLRNTWSILGVFLLPLTLIVSGPTKAILGKFDTPDALLILVGAGVLLVASHYFWIFALRSYSSASG